MEPTVFGCRGRKAFLCIVSAEMKLLIKFYGFVTSNDFNVIDKFET